MVGLPTETAAGNGKLELGVAPEERWAVARYDDRSRESKKELGITRFLLALRLSQYRREAQYQDLETWMK